MRETVLALLAAGCGPRTWGERCEIAEDEPPEPDFAGAATWTEAAEDEEICEDGWKLTGTQAGEPICLGCWWSYDVDFVALKRADEPASCTTGRFGDSFTWTLSYAVGVDGQGWLMVEESVWNPEQGDAGDWTPWAKANWDPCSYTLDFHREARERGRAVTIEGEVELSPE